jgi:hypothetical protein
MIEVCTFTAPACWACYLVNGDASNLSDREQARALTNGWNRSHRGALSASRKMTTAIRKSHGLQAATVITAVVQRAATFWSTSRTNTTRSRTCFTFTSARKGMSLVAS